MKVYLAMVLLAVALARESKVAHKEALKGDKRLAKKKCDGQIESYNRRITALEDQMTIDSTDITNLHKSLGNEIDSALSKANSFDEKISASKQAAEVVKTHLDSITTKIGSIKEELMGEMKKLENGMGNNHNEIGQVQGQLDKLKVPTENIMPNARVEGCFDTEGTRQPTESWKYESAIKPLEKVNDPLVYNSVIGGNGGWSVISTRLGPNDKVGVGIIDLQAEYLIKKFVVFGWGNYMKEVEIFQWNSESTPDFDEKSTIANEANWKSMGKLSNLGSTARYPNEYTVPNNIECEFRGRYIKTTSKATIIQVIAGIKAFGWKQ